MYLTQKNVHLQSVWMGHWPCFMTFISELNLGQAFLSFGQQMFLIEMENKFKLNVIQQTIPLILKCERACRENWNVTLIGNFMAQIKCISLHLPTYFCVNGETQRKNLRLHHPVCCICTVAKKTSSPAFVFNRVARSLCQSGGGWFRTMPLHRYCKKYAGPKMESTLWSVS